MLAPPDTAPQTGTFPANASPWGWPSLLRLAALAVALTAVAAQLAGRFVGPSLVVLTLSCLAGAVLVGRRPRAAAVLLVVVCVLNLLLHGWVLGLLAAAPHAGTAVALSVLDLVGSVVVIVSGGAVLLRRGATGRAPAVVAGAGLTVVALAAVTTFTLYATRADVTAEPGEPVLVHTGRQVDPATLDLVADGGRASLVVRNEDPLYPRSFVIDELELSVVLPPRTGERVELPPGTYRFYDHVTMTEATSGEITVRP